MTEGLHNTMRPQTMHLEQELCIDCGLCYLIAPEIGDDPQRISVSGSTLEAMAACPTGAIVWDEPPRREAGQHG
jgi:ferredoxin